MAMENVMKEMMAKELASNADTVKKAEKAAAEKAEENVNGSEMPMDMKFDSAGAERLLDAIFGGQTEGIEIHIDTLNIHIGDHMKSVNFMSSGDANENEKIEDDDIDDCCDECDDFDNCDDHDDFAGISAAKAIHVDTERMKKAVAKVTGIDRRTVDKVLDGVRIFLEVTAEQEDGHDR